mgnify:FL=1
MDAFLVAENRAVDVREFAVFRVSDIDDEDVFLIDQGFDVLGGYLRYSAREHVGEGQESNDWVLGEECKKVIYSR